VAGAWVELSPIEIEDVKDIELSRDGKTLYILANHAIHGLDLDDPLASPVLLHTDAGTVYHSITNHYWQLAIAGDNHALITSEGNPFEWQPGSPTVALVQPQLGNTSHALMVVPADGSAIHVSGGDAQRYLPATGQLALVPGFGSITAANADGSRLLNLNYVYDQDYALVGKVRAGWVFSAYGRRNDRIYAIRADQQDYTGLGRYVYAVDPTGTPDADNVFPEVRRIEIPVSDMPTVYPYGDRAPATVSADNRTFFFHGGDKLIIVPTGD
jgi:hypothetical protein